MSEEEDRKSAYSDLDDAVKGVVDVVGGTERGVITDYIIVLHQVNYTDEGNRVDNYNILKREGSIPFHVAKGLLSVGMDLMDNFYLPSDEDEDDD